MVRHKVVILVMVTITLGLAALAMSQAVEPATGPAIDPEQVQSTIEVLRQNPEQMQALMEEFQQNPQQFRGLMESIRQNPQQLKAIMDEVRQNPDQLNAIVSRAASKNMQQVLGAKDDEWSILGPKIAAVTALQAQLRIGPQGVRMLPQLNATSRPARTGQNKLQQLAAELARLGHDDQAQPADVKIALESYRQARSEVRTSLDKAIKELTEILTVRQEAQLTVMGILETP